MYHTYPQLPVENLQNRLDHAEVFLRSVFRFYDFHRPPREGPDFIESDLLYPLKNREIMPILTRPALSMFYEWPSPYP